VTLLLLGILLIVFDAVQEKDLRTSEATILSILGAEILFTLGILYFLFHKGKLAWLCNLFGLSAVLTGIGFRLGGGSSLIIFYVTIMIYGGLTSISLPYSVGLICFFVTALTIIDVSCSSIGGFTGDESAAIAIQFFAFIMVNTFGIYNAYFQHYSIRRSYLKTLAFAKNEKGTYLLASESVFNQSTIYSRLNNNPPCCSFRSHCT